MILKADAIRWQDWQVVDVRSEKEWEQSHIPGAINIPILDNTARDVVGRVYRQYGREEAIEKGLQHTLPQLDELIRRFRLLLEKGKVLLYCARGGMRSHSIYNLLRSFYCDQLALIEEGYKGYRQVVLEGLDRLSCERRLIVLQGYTGVGKSEILDELARRGEAVLQLERLAAHSGSVFGNLPFHFSQPSQKQFENNLYHRLLASQGPFFTEAENRSLGKIHLPNRFFEKLRASDHVLIQASMDDRIGRIAKDYLPSSEQDDLLESLDHLRRNLGHQVVDRLQDKLRRGESEAVIRYLMEKHYDPLYGRFIKRNPEDYLDRIEHRNLDETIERLQRLSQ